MTQLAASPSASPARPFSIAKRSTCGCYVALRLAGWLATCAGLVAGLWVLFFAMLGEFTFAGFALHLDNFAARFLAAQPERRALFETRFWTASGVLLGIVGLLRRHGLADLFAKPEETADGQV